MSFLLGEAGSTLFLCRGLEPQGFFHSKAAVVDRRYLYSGSPNFSFASHGNEDFCFRITGPAVGQVLEKLCPQRLKRKPWDGS